MHAINSEEDRFPSKKKQSKSQCGRSVEQTKEHTERAHTLPNILHCDNHESAEKTKRQNILYHTLRILGVVRREPTGVILPLESLSASVSASGLKLPRI